MRKATRKRISKETRQQVYDKFNGHCAYCGCKLDYKDMQVDHMYSMGEAELNELKGIEQYNQDKLDEFDNLMPACRQCNHYKLDYSMEQFRSNIKRTVERMHKPLNFHIAKKYGILVEKEWDGLFYFEKKNECK